MTVTLASLGHPGCPTAPTIAQGDDDMIDHTLDECIDGARIDLDDYFDLRSWAKRFRVTAGDVRRAVSAVGNQATTVEAWLARRRQAVGAGDGHAVGSPG